MIYLVTPLFRLFVLMLDILEFLWNSYWDIVKTCVYAIVPKSEKSISGKTVLVTGAANGVGEQLARVFASEGCNVICWDIDQEGNAATAQSLHALSPDIRLACRHVDVSNEAAVRDAADQVITEFGKVDILVNNAGIMPVKRFLSHTPDEIQRVFQVNVLSQIWTLRAFLPAMYSSGSGAVISLSSNCGLLGSANLAPYCASKHAIRGLMEALTEEERHFSQNKRPIVQHLTVFPYIINTQMVKYPRVRFPWLMPVLTAGYVAREIVKALKQGEEVLFFPKWMYPAYLFSRLWPRAMQQRFYNLVDAGVDERVYDVSDEDM